jgi:hypothetical protein
MAVCCTCTCAAAYRRNRHFEEWTDTRACAVGSYAATISRTPRPPLALALPQVMYCLCGLGLAMVTLPKNAALLGAMQLAIGDPVSALVGHLSRPYG